MTTKDFIQKANKLSHLPLCFRILCKNKATESCVHCGHVYCAKHQGGNNDFCNGCSRILKREGFNAL